MTVRETSLEAYEYIKREGILSLRQEQVLKAISESPLFCNKQISEKYNIPINVVTARMNELVTLGIVEDFGATPQPNGRKAHIWQVKPEPKIATILKLKKRLKKIRCPMRQGKGHVTSGQTTLN